MSFYVNQRLMIHYQYSFRLYCNPGNITNILQNREDETPGAHFISIIMISYPQKKQEKEI